MLFGGMDVSGNKEGNYKVMGMVVGTEEVFGRIMKDLSTDDRYDTEIKNNTNRRFFVSKLQFINKDIIAQVVTINRDDVINKVKSYSKVKRRGISGGKIHRSYNYLVWSKSRDVIQEFIVDHRHELRDVAFQCDSDCRRFVKDNGLCNADPGDAYFIADLVAWAKNNGTSIPV